CHIGGLGAREQEDEFCRRKGGAAIGDGLRGHGILVGLRCERERLYADLAQKHETGGGGGREADLHAHHRILGECLLPHPISSTSTSQASRMAAPSSPATRAGSSSSPTRSPASGCGRG